MVFTAIRSQLAKTVPFAKTLGIEITDVGSGFATATLPDDASTANHLGARHAGALVALGDVVAGAALAGAFGQKVLQLRPVVESEDVRYLKNARGAITASAKVDGAPKALASAVDADGSVPVSIGVTFTDPSGETVATMAVRYAVGKTPKR